MSKLKETPNTDVRIIQIKERLFKFDVPDDFQAKGDFQFFVALEIGLNPTKQKFFVDNRIEVRAEADGPALCSQDTRYYFELVSPKTLESLPADLQLAVNTIAISTSRGLLFSRLRGTALHNAVLPLIDASNFSANEVK
ncbi:hypothetical protein GCM10027037_00360 [Mucilaginibacter koreensis]